MTSLACWAAADSRAIASIYVASDSRITSDDRVLSDSAKKVFACRTRSDILAYCGNAERPPGVLAKMAAQLDATPLTDDENAWSRAHRLTQQLNGELPLGLSHPYAKTKFIYATRDGCGFKTAAFAAFRIEAVGHQWDFSTLILPNPLKEHERSDIIFAEGSGATHVRNWRDNWEKFHASELEHRTMGGTTRVRTSRGVFAGFCTALRFGQDPASGGAPQLAVIYQEDAALSLGMIWDGQRYFEGRACTREQALALKTRWHDHLLHVCDPDTMQRREDASRHAAPARGFDPMTSRAKHPRRR